MRRKPITSAVVLTLLAFASGCAYPNQFHNVRTESPHAVLVGKRVTLFHINEQPTSFWRTRERFRVPPGTTTVRVISGHRGEVHYPLLRATAIPCSDSRAPVRISSSYETEWSEWLLSWSGRGRPYVDVG
jgi:hypothetical protein